MKLIRWMLNLRNKILFAAVTLVILCQLTSMFMMMRVVRENMTKQAIESLNTSANLATGITTTQANQASIIIKALASDTEFLAAVERRDENQVRLLLNDQNVKAGAKLSFVNDSDYQIIAGTDPNFSAGTDLKKLFSSYEKPINTTVLMQHNGTPHYMITIPIELSGQSYWITMGYAIDSNYIARAEKLIGLQLTVFSVENDQPKVFISSLPATLYPDTEKAIRSIRSSAGGHPDFLKLGSTEYLATVRDFVRGDKRYKVLVSRTVAEALATYTMIHRVGVILTLVPLVLALGAAILLSRSLTRPISDLMGAAKRIQVGNYDDTIVVDTADELNEFAEAFNAMQKEIAAREERITWQATHDSLTGLVNAEHAQNYLSAALRQASENNSQLAVMVVSLNARQEISSSLGQQMADAYLNRAAQTIRTYLNDDFIVARLELDTFFVIMPSTDSISAQQIAADLVDRLHPGIELPNAKISVRPRIGIAAYPQHGDSRERLMLRATIARNEAKHDKSPISIYREGDEEQNVRNISLLQDLRDAISNDRLMMYYQPKINVADETVYGVEALVRWDHPVYGWLPPNDFVPLIEKSGNISLLTRWALETVARQYSCWCEQGLDFLISVNLSAHDLMDQELPWFIMDILRGTDLPPEKLVAEITEQAMVEDLHNATTILTRLRDLGIKISIDDFGTGYSSFAQLKELPVDELKIDRSFVATLPVDKADAAIVSTAIDLAHKLNLQTVAEGVTDGKAYRWLRAHGIDRAQGYYWAKPMPPEELSAWVQNYSGGSTQVVRTLDLSSLEPAS